MFQLDPNADIAGTSLAYDVDLAPAFLVERFGRPLPGDGSRCTGRYAFVDERGSVFTVYEYKCTSAFRDDEDDALPPAEFWQSKDAQELSVGSRGGLGDESAQPFVQWLTAEYQAWRSTGG